MSSLPPDESATDRARADAGVLGNERLTALTGAVLLVLFAVEIVTVVLLHELMPAHFFVGVLLIGPVAVKSAATGWRFLRYYARRTAYRRKGPPRLAMRVLSPFLLASTLVVIGSGVALALTGPAPTVLLRIHVISFLVWVVLIIVHVVAYAARVPRLILADWRRRPVTAARPAVAPAARPAVAPAPVPGRWARLAINIAAVVAAGIAAVLLLPTAARWTGWLEQGVSAFGVVAVVAIAGTGAMTAARRRRRRVE